jgi:hypothetical protein
MMKPTPIPFSSLSIAEESTTDVKNHMTALGYSQEDADRFGDAAAIICANAFRSLDFPVAGFSQDPTDQVVLQQIIMRLMLSTAQEVMNVHSAQALDAIFMDIIFGRRKN